MKKGRKDGRTNEGRKADSTEGRQHGRKEGREATKK
jgi:hypothetical protein